MRYFRVKVGLTNLAAIERTMMAIACTRSGERAVPKFPVINATEQIGGLRFKQLLRPLLKI